MCFTALILPIDKPSRSEQWIDKVAHASPWLGRLELVINLKYPAA
jgi:hypothetical protein